MKVLVNRSEDRLALIKQIVSLAETARRDGLLALESRIEEIENPLVRTGIQLAVDGSSPVVVEEILRTEVESIASRHREGRNMMEQLSRYAPAYGMIGTLLGLIMMLHDMSDPSGIGAGMAIALITTLYGAVVANVFFGPFAEKLGMISRSEMIGFEIAIRGVLAIQSGESPRAIDQKLRTFLHPKQRAKE
jgi:chemotaxis protein MotA